MLIVMNNQQKGGKPTYERAVKKSVSMPEILFDNGTARMRQYGFSQFSDYVQLLIRRDTKNTSLAP